MSHPLFDLTGRVALVSGTASGLGRAMAIGFAEAGADLMLADINTQGNEATAARIEGLGRRALPVTCDVSDPEQIHQMFSRLDREYGRLDVLGNVAGEYVRAVNNNHLAEVTAVVGRDRAKTEARAQSLGLSCQVMDRYSDMVARSHHP